MSLEIHILNADYDPRREKLGKKKHRKLANNDSQFSKVCNNIFTTYQYMGDKSLDIYKGCKDQHELLGKTDTEMIKSRPFCFDGIDQFFCNYKIETTIKKEKGAKNSCGKEELINLILRMIKGCLTVQNNFIKI